MLSPTGRSVPFDAGADGIVLGEGVGAVVLKNLSAALADGDRGPRGDQGEPESTATAAPTASPRRDATSQAELLRAVHRRAGVEAGNIGYVEARAATSLGDPIEVKALNARYRACPDGPGFTALGSVRPASATPPRRPGQPRRAAQGRTGPAPPRFLARLRRGRLLRPGGGAFEVVREPASSRAAGANGVRVAGQRGFGFSGTNCHVVLAEPHAPPRAPADGGRTWSRCPAYVGRSP